MMLKHELIKTFISWADNLKGYVKEVKIVGSQAKISNDNKLLSESDIDLFLIIQNGVYLETVYSDLARIGKDINFVLHPIIILENERELKLNILEYSETYSKGQLIYKSAN